MTVPFSQAMRVARSFAHHALDELVSDLGRSSPADDRLRSLAPDRTSAAEDPWSCRHCQHDNTRTRMVCANCGSDRRRQWGLR